MMRNLLALVTASCATAAGAGGLDRSGQPVDLLFKPGRYVEAAVAYRSPDVRGTDEFGARSGEVWGGLTDFGGGFKTDIGARWSAAVIVGQPWGADVAYPKGAFAYAGTFAKAETLGLTGLLRYRIDDRFSLHGGLRATDVRADVGLDGIAFGNLGYRWTGAHDWGIGYVLGGAYEIPAIALRVALTYGSETPHELDSVENYPVAVYRSETQITMPQSVNLDFQTGVTPRTLVFASVRWVNWKDWSVAPEGLALIGGGDLVHFDSDTFTYRIGLARQFGARTSGAIEVRHETPKSQVTGALDPYDGYTSVTAGASYRHPSGLDIGLGVSWCLLGDATSVAPQPGGVSARFDNNRVVAAGLKLGYAF